MYSIFVSACKALMHYLLFMYCWYGYTGLLFFLLEHSPPAWPEGLAAITECSPRIVQQLTLFSRQLASEGIQQVWVSDTRI